ncbi:hypothetical protein MED121_22237 [Marinomonas sp. MED121]|nr:hypothetical protein MED121_22237 [Marinomonas sp. MED121]
MGFLLELAGGNETTCYQNVNLD